MRPVHILTVVVAGALAAFACGGSSDSPTSPSGGGATLSLMLKDSPFTDHDCRAGWPQRLDRDSVG